MIENLLIQMVTNEIGSKVEGRRNWIIITHKNGIMFNGGFGQACRRGLLDWRICDMIDNQINFFEYTYKKDYLEALEKIHHFFNKKGLTNPKGYAIIGVQTKER